MSRARFTTIGLAALASVGAVLATAGTASADPPGPAFYVDGVQYATVGTPTDFSGTGAPDSSFDTIYDLGGAQMNIATAAPGDTDFNGGRWKVHAISFPNGYGDALESGDLNDNGVLDSDHELDTAIDEGDAHDDGVVKYFECPVIPLGGHA